MKLNWGHYIVIVFIGFILLVGYMVMRSYSLNHDLVTEDYYAKELQFQDQLDEMERANQLTENISWEWDGTSLMVIYPEMDKPIDGKIEIRRPSDQKLDFDREIKVGSNNNQSIHSAEWTHGKYMIQIHWNVDDIEYYTEGVFHVTL